MTDLRILNIGQAVDVFPDQTGQPYSDLIRDHGPSVLGPYTFPSYDDGFRQLLKLGLISEYRAVPFLGLLERMSEGDAWRQINNIAREMSANVIFLHFFHHPHAGDPRPGIASLQSLPSRPIIALSCGDPLYGMLTRPPRSFIQAAALSDVTFLTGMGAFAKYLVRSGVTNLLYLPHGSCQLRFQNALVHGVKPEYDVCFIGNGRLPRNPAKHYFYAALRRNYLVRRLASRWGKQMAVFGAGWEGVPGWQGICKYHEQQTMCSRSRVIIGGMPNAYFDYYMSDRPFIAAGSGRPLVDWHLPGVDATLVDGQDWFLVHTVKEYIHKVEQLLERPQSDLDAIGSRAADTVRNRHTTAHRSGSMTQVFQDLVNSRSRGTLACAPSLETLGLHGVSRRTQADVVIRWKG